MKRLSALRSLNTWEAAYGAVYTPAHVLSRCMYRTEDVLIMKDTVLTCNQILVLVDLQLDSTKTLRGFCVDVLNMWHYLEAPVHLKKE